MPFSGTVDLSLLNPHRRLLHLLADLQAVFWWDLDMGKEKHVIVQFVNMYSR
jgi:hypothetical protein